jgi:hypothetical protein
MTASVASAAMLPKPPTRRRAVGLMLALGVVTGLISSLPSPLPDLHLGDSDILINARAVPLHAGIVYGAMLACMLWLWASRDPSKCLLAMALTLIGWLAAINTANDLITRAMTSELFGTAEGAKANRELLGWLVGGVSAGAVGAGLTAFGVGIASTAMRRVEAWAPVVAMGAVLGFLLYPAASLDAVILLFVPWQAGVSATIAYALTRPRG